MVDVNKKYNEGDRSPQIFSTRVQLLKKAYEHRLNRFEEAIDNIISSLMSDVILSQMKTDPVSQTFIPTHIAEYVSSQIHHERELYIQEILSNLVHSEQKNIEFHQELQVSAENMAGALRDIQTKATEIEKLRNEIDTHRQSELKQNDENMKLKKRVLEVESKTNTLQELLYMTDLRYKGKCEECDSLKATLQSRETSTKMEYKSQYDLLKQQNSKHIREYEEIKQENKLLKNEVSTLQSVLRINSEDHEKINEMVKKLTMQLEQKNAKVNEHNDLVIDSMHTKMKELHSHLVNELHKEQSVSASLRVKIAELRNACDSKLMKQHQQYLMELTTEKNLSMALKDQVSSLRYSVDETMQLRDNLVKEEGRSAALQQQVVDLSAHLAAARKAVNDAENRLQLAAQALEQQREKHSQELKLAGERVNEIVEEERSRAQRMLLAAYSRWQQALSLSLRAVTQEDDGDILETESTSEVGRMGQQSTGVGGDISFSSDLFS